MITLEISEAQVVEWVQQLSPEAKQAVLRTLIPRLDEVEALVDYGSQRAREVAAKRGLDWDSLDEEQRERFIDSVLHGL